MQLSDFDFELPPHLIAQYPAKERTQSKLLYVQQNQFQHKKFYDVINFLKPNDLLVLNNTKVFPARLLGQKLTGGRVEVLIERILDEHHVLAQIKASKSPRIGESLQFGDVSLHIKDKAVPFYTLHSADPAQTILQIIEKIGHIPLPPYMQRAPLPEDKERYQTVYAKHQGSVAAPTAGLHFDLPLLHTLQERKINIAYLTLHIGAGTFAPIRVTDIKQHQMHAEYIEVSATLCEQIQQTKAKGGRIVAVGTTTLRALESASQTGEIQPFYGETRIFIYPGYQFQCVDSLITNLHLPRSTLLMLVCAFAGYKQTMAAYQEAIAQSYRFYSYGDAMWLDRI